MRPHNHNYDQKNQQHNYNLIYSNEKSKLYVWEAKPIDNYYPVGQVITDTHVKPPYASILVKSNGEKTIVSLRPERALINTKEKMENNFKGKIEEVIYHGDHTRVRLNLLGNKDFILKVPNSSANMDIKLGNEIGVSWNSFDARALDPK